MEGILRENLLSPSCRRPQSPQKDCLDYCFQVQGTWKSILFAREQWTLQAHARSTRHHRRTNARRRRNYSQSTGENADRCRPRCLKKYHYLSAEDSGLDISWQQILPDDSYTKQRKKGSCGHATTNATRSITLSGRMSHRFSWKITGHSHTGKLEKLPDQNHGQNIPTK